MRNIKMTFAYDGTNYHGFQKQQGRGLPTVQEVLESVLSEMAGRRVKVYGAGRTDAGVHALGQVVNFDATRWPIPTGRLVKALNGALPRDIAALQAEEVPSDFHARFSARGKKYLYVLYNADPPSPFEARYSYHFPRPLNIKAMQEAATNFLGTHDFKAFQAANSPVRSTTRTIFSSNIWREEKKIYFSFSGDGFLYKMIRTMVGTLLEIGLEKHDPEHVRRVITAKDRSLAGPTAPPQGLYLQQVYYDGVLPGGNKEPGVTRLPAVSS